MQADQKVSASKSEPWKHHFVPRSLLKYFRASGEGEFIFVFNKESGRGFRTSLMNAGSQNGFNTLQEGGDTVNFEADFDKVDALLAHRLREIHDKRNLSGFSEEQRRDWAELVAVQLIRTPIARSTMKEFSKDLREKVAGWFGDEADFPFPSENDVRKAARGNFTNRAELQRLLMKKDFVLFKAPAEAPLRISDRPIILDSALPYGDIGLASLGVMVFMPLGIGLVLGLLCPSIARKLSRVPLDKLGLPDDVYARWNALNEGLVTGGAVNLDLNTVIGLNRRQIAGCQQFVYGPANDFEDVKQLLVNHPQARVVNSTVVLGNTPKPRMPLGSWLVLFGRSDSHMLEVRDVSNNNQLEVTFVDERLLAAALADGPFVSMEYYEDRHCLCGMRDVKLVFPPHTPQLRAQVRHADAGLDGLMSKIGL